MHELLHSTAIAFVGRHNSGKTTLVCAVIEELARRGLDVGTIKHHGHVGFEIDVPGKDSYRHRHAGATEVVIAAPDAIARIKDIAREVECSDLLQTMPGHDIVVVEGYRESGLPYIEVMRAASERDQAAAKALLEGEPPASMVAAASDMPEVLDYARRQGLQAFPLPDAEDVPAFAALAASVADFIEQGYARPKVTVALQAGGESRRMGTSKALVPFNGRPLISHMVERLLPAADELIITTNEAERLAFLLDEYPEAGIRLVPDIFPERGALAGFATAFEAAQNPLVAIVACDMALASPVLLAHQVERLVQTGADAVVPANRHGFEPMHAVYRRDVCRPKARDLVESGSMRIRDLIDAIDVCELTPAEVRAIVPLGGVFANANTPEELAKLEELSKRS
ncbi:MAG: molybdopterin-guanine dinucleotide biosynthesis protein B [Coriobacteriaceae bacterium]|nr:molybdopterin-guanine dinucleotide biosynthesis protein B [Coriobacteriaceae bacterium]